MPTPVLESGILDPAETLPADERRVLQARRLADEPITLEELADEFGVSRERVRQIEVRAFEKVQKAVKSHITAMENPPAAAAGAAAVAAAH